MLPPHHPPTVPHSRPQCSCTLSALRLEYWFFTQENNQPMLLPPNPNSTRWCNFWGWSVFAHWEPSHIFFFFSFNLFYSACCLLLSPASSVSALQLSPRLNVNEALSTESMMVSVLSLVSGLIRGPSVADIYTVCRLFTRVKTIHSETSAGQILFGRTRSPVDALCPLSTLGWEGV